MGADRVGEVAVLGSTTRSVPAKPETAELSGTTSAWSSGDRVSASLSRAATGGWLSGVASTLGLVSVTVDLPAATLRRLEAEAARRGVGIDVVIAELVETLPAEDAGQAPVRRRKLAIAGVGASGGQRGRAADADELLADGFGRS